MNDHIAENLIHIASLIARYTNAPIETIPINIGKMQRLAESLIKRYDRNEYDDTRTKQLEEKVIKLGKEIGVEVILCAEMEKVIQLKIGKWMQLEGFGY